jgi:signal transduction histidine kinase
MLSEFLSDHRESLILRARGKVLQRRVPLPTDYELQHGVPIFLDQLIETLRLEAKRPGRPMPEMGVDAAHHASDLFKQGFTVGQLVHDYGDICQAVTELAEEVKAKITTDEFHTLNRCLDNVTAEAVTEYGRQRELQASDAETERLGFFAHELRNLIQAAVLSFQILRRGAVGVAGSTGNAHERTLRHLCDLIDRTLAEVRLDAKIQQDAHFPLAPLIDEVAFPANLEAKNRGVELLVAPPEGAHEVEADRHLLASAISNVLQNAFKFTRKDGCVSLRTLASGNRVLIEIEDECGGLPPDRADELFRPFSQRATDRSGLGLGLAISRRAVEQSGGSIRVRDLPGKGCIFTIDLPLARPRSPASG